MDLQYVQYYMQRVYCSSIFTSQHRPCEINLSLQINENESFIDNNDKRLGMVFLLVLSKRLTQVGIEMKSVQFSSPSRLLQSQEAEKIFVLFLEQKYVEEVG